jgi:uncharacterized SAM-binding protein YcdF (DUF218 family)
MNAMSRADDADCKSAAGKTMTVEAPAARRALAGLLVRRECWRLSIRGKVACLLLALVCVAALRQGVFPFLALNDRASTEVLVLEGWMPAYVVNQVAPQAVSGSYRQILIARPLYAGRTEYESGEALAKYVAESLIKLGVPRERVHIVFSEASDRDRTYRSAMAVRNWMEKQGLDVHAIDVGTLGPHARRSRLLFQRAFGKDVRVGVISFEDQDYDPAHWWRSSAGVREVPFEMVAYLYVKFLFKP